MPMEHADAADEGFFREPLGSMFDTLLSTASAQSALPPGSLSLIAGHWTFDRTPSPDARFGTATADYRVRNLTGERNFARLFLRVRAHSPNILVLNAHRGGQGVGAELDVTDLGGDGILGPGETSGKVTVKLGFVQRGPVGILFDLFEATSPNASPVFQWTPLTEVALGETLRDRAVANDPDGDVVTYELLFGPEGLSLDGVTGDIIWTPTSPGEANYAVRATDPLGHASDREVSVHVLDLTPPVVELSVPIEAPAGTSVEVAVTASDNVGIESLDLFLDGESFASLSAPPYMATLLLPSGPVGSSVTVLAQARDAAGNLAEDAANILLIAPPDELPPTILLSAPLEVVEGEGITLVAEVDDNVGVVAVEFLSRQIPLGTVTEPPFEISYVAPVGLGEVAITAQATAIDGAGNRASDSASIQLRPSAVDTPPRVDLIGPTTAAIGDSIHLLALTDDDQGIDVVTFSLGSDTLLADTEPPYELPVVVPATVTAGDKLGFSSVARDTAGQETVAQLVVTAVDGIDDAPPRILSIALPPEVAPGASFYLTAEVVDDGGVAEVQIASSDPAHPDLLATARSRPYSVELSAPTDPGTFEVTIRALDFAGNEAVGSAATEVVADSIAEPPSIDLTAPAAAAAGTRITLVAIPNDNVGVETVYFFQGTALIGEVAAAPYRLDFDLPVAASPGDTLGFRARVRNLHGLEADASAAVRVLERREVLLSGEVYRAENGHPLAGALVEALDTTASTATDDRGRYRLLVPEGRVRLRLTAPGHQTLYRSLTTARTEALDVLSAHLKALPEQTTLSRAFGGEVEADTGGALLDLPAGTLPADTELRLLELGPQGLTDLLPLGWSPMSAHLILPEELQLAAGAHLRLPGLVAPSDELVVVRYDAQNGVWTRIDAPITREGDDLLVPVSQGGTYSLVLPDLIDGPPQPTAGEPLVGVEARDVGADIAAEVAPSNPIIVSSVDEITDVRVRLAGLGQAPSGSAVRMDVREHYRFADDSALTLPLFPHDLIVYRRGASAPPAPSPVQAEGMAGLLLAPRLEFGVGELAAGQIDLAVAERPADALIRLIDPTGATLVSEEVQLVVGAGEVAQAASAVLERLDRDALPLALPDGLDFVAAATLALPGFEDSLEATFSVPVLASDGPLLLLALDQIDGRSSYLIAGEGQVVDGVAQVTLELRDGSTWVLARAAADTGVLVGQVLRESAPVSGAVVTADASPLAVRSAADGSYRLPLPAGQRQVRALFVTTGERASGTAEVAPGTDAELDLSLQGATAQVVSLSPADGAADVSLGTTVILEFSQPVDPASFGAPNVVLRGPGGALPVDYVLLPGGLSGALRPRAVLEPLTGYEIVVTDGLRSEAGMVFTQAFSGFQTLDTARPERPDPGRIAMTMPDAAGLVRVSGTSGTVRGETAVTLINDTSGATVTRIAAADGSFQLRIIAAVTDSLRLVLRNGQGDEVSVSLGLFDAGDGTAVVGAEGGTMRAPDGSVLTFTPGSFDEPTTVVYQRKTEADFPEIPIADFGPAYGLSFAAGFSLTFPDSADGLQQRLGLRIPVTESYPQDSRFLIARIDEVRGEPLLIAVEDARFVDGAIEVNSPPWPGIFGIGGMIANSFMALLLPRQDLSFVRGKITTGEQLGMLNLSVSCEAVIGGAANLMATALVTTPDPTIRLKRIELLEQVLPGVFNAIDSATFSGSSGSLFKSVAINSNQLTATLSLVSYALLGQQSQIYRAVATFDKNGRDVRAEVDASTIVVPTLSDLNPCPETGGMRQAGKAVFNVPDPGETTASGERARAKLRPFTGAYVELNNGVGTSYPTVTTTNQDGNFTLAGKPGSTYLRIIDPLTGQGSSFRITIPDELFTYTDVGTIVVPERQGDVQPPQLEVQVTGSLTLGSPITVTVNTSDDQGIASVTARIDDIAQINQRYQSGNPVSTSDSFQYTPIRAGETKIIAEVFDVNGNSTRRENVLRIFESAAALPPIVAGGNVTLVQGSVNVPLEPSISVQISPSAPPGTDIELIANLDIYFEDPATGGRIPVEGGVVSSGNRVQIRPSRPLPANTDLQLVINGQTIGFRTGGTNPSPSTITAGRILDIAARGDLAFVADFTGEVVKIVDTSDLTNLQVVGGIPMPGGPRAVAVVPSSVFLDTSNGVTENLLVAVGAGFGGGTGQQEKRPPYLRLFDISDPTKPVRVGNVQLFPLADQVIPTEVAVLGSTAYVASIGAGIQVIDLEQLTLGQKVSLRQQLRQASNVFERRDAQENALGTPYIIGGFRLPAPKPSAAVGQTPPADYAPPLYLPYLGNAFSIGTGIPGMLVTGGASQRLYVVSNTGGAALGLIPSLNANATPFAVEEGISRITTAGDFTIRKDLDGDGIAEFQNLQLAVVSHGSSGNISLVDLSKPTEPVIRNLLNAGNFVQDVPLINGIIYTGDRTIDIQDPDEPLVSTPIVGAGVGGSAELIERPRAPAQSRTLLGLSSSEDRTRLQAVELAIPDDRPDWDLIRTTLFEPRINPDNEDYLNTGDPINPFTGEVRLCETDLAIPGRGLHFEFVRTYRSQNQFNGPMGYGWDHRYNDRLTIDKNTRNVIRYDGSGRADVFASIGPDQWRAPTGVFAELTRISPIRLEITEADGTRFIYQPSIQDPQLRYRLAFIVDRYGNTLSFGYELINDRLSRIRDSLGRTIRFRHNVRGRMISMQDWSGRLTSYEYDAADNLIAVTGPATADFPHGKTTRYRYTEGLEEFTTQGSPADTARLNHNLVSVTDPTGQTYLEFSYDLTLLDGDALDFDRVQTQRLGCPTAPALPCGGTYRYSYFGADGSGTSPARVTRAETENREGHRTIRHYSPSGHLERLEELVTINGNPTTLVTELSYTPDGLLESETTPRGLRTLTHYDSTNPDRLRQADLTGFDIHPIGGGAPRSTVLTPGPYGVPTTIIDPSGAATTHVVDNNGNILRVDHAPVNQPVTTGPPVTEAYTYGPRGELRTHTAGDGVVTRYTYYGADDPNGDGDDTETLEARESGQLVSGPGYIRSVIVDASNGGAGITRSARGPPLDLETTFTYDPVGNLLTTTDPRGNTVTRVVNALNQPISIADPRGTRYFAYDGNDSLIELRDLGGRTLTYAYDCLDQLRSITDSGDGITRVTAFDYDANENPSGRQSPLGHRLVTQFDERELPVAISTEGGLDPVVGPLETLDYDEDANLVRRTDGEGHSTTYTYNGFNELESVTDANGNRLEMEYDARGLVVTERRRDDQNRILREIFTDRDALGRAYRTREPIRETPGGSILDEDVTLYVYDAASRVNMETDVLGRELKREFDGLGRAVLVEDAVGNVEESVFGGLDLQHQLLKDLEPDGSVVTTRTDFDFDLFGRLEAIRGPLGRTTTFDYDERDNLERRTVQGGADVVMGYDAFNRLRSIANGRELSNFDYDDDDRLIREEDAQQRGTTMAYDGRNRLRSTRYQDGTEVLRTYNLDDTLDTTTDRAGNHFTYSYDDGNRQTGVTVVPQPEFAGSPNYAFGYDALDRVVSATRAGASPYSVAFEYDSRSAMTNEVQGGLDLISTFDLAGDRRSLQYPSGGFSLGYEIDPLTRVEAIREAGRTLASYNFSGPLLRSQAAFGNGTSVGRLFNDAREETSREFLDPNQVSLGSFSYARNQSGRIYGVARAHRGGRGDAFVYSPEQWLSEVRWDTAAPLDLPIASQPAPNRLIEYTYDASGNWADRTDNAAIETFVSNALNQYDSAGAAQLVYDDNGNLRDDGTRAYTYDAYGHLTRVTTNGGTTELARYEYDALDRRVREITPSGVEHYIYDGDNLVLVLDGASAIKRQYVYGDAVDRPVLLRIGNADSYYQLDGMGSVVALSDAAGAVIERYRYDPFGRTQIEDPSGAPRAASVVGNRRGFMGQYLDSATGLVRMGVRDYSPDLGRFLQPDPAGTADGQNLYAYAGADPVNFSDPTGLFRKASLEDVRIASFAEIDLPLIGKTDIRLSSAVDIAAAVSGIAQLAKGAAKSGLKGARAVKRTRSVARRTARQADTLVKTNYVSKAKAIQSARRATTVAEKARILKKAGFGKDARRSMMKNGRVCFVAGTKVLTKDGLENIEEILEGDLVLSRSDETGAQGYKRVVSLFQTHPSKLVHIRYRSKASSSNAGNEGERANELVSTAEHPYWLTEEQRWAQAGEIRTGDRLSLSDGDIAKVTEVDYEHSDSGQPFTTYNFEVEDFHTYFVSGGSADAEAEGVWVHNAGPQCAQGARSKARSKQVDETSFAGLIDLDEFNNSPVIADRLSRAREFDIAGYHDLTARGSYGRLFDHLDSDEALQNLFVRYHKGVERKSAILRDNPAVALTRPLHSRIRNLKTPDIQGKSAEAVLQHHLNEMRAFAPPEVIVILEREALRYIRQHFP